MRKRNLENALRFLQEKIDKGFLGNKEMRIAYFFGIMEALDVMTRVAGLHLLTPFERETFIGSAKANLFSAADCEGLGENLKFLNESGDEDVARSSMVAASLNTALGLSLTEFERLELENNISMLKYGKK